MNARILSLVVMFGSLFASVSAEPAADIQARMNGRLAAIDQLKIKEAIGENQRGFVEVRKNEADADKLVAAENRDREEVYALIAQKTGSNADAVGRARAKQIAAKSPAGIWLQDDTGRWYRK